METTIVAVSTPPGRGGLGVVRLSGPEALRIGRTVAGLEQLEPRRATLALFRDADGALLDEVVVTSFPAPRSVTAEDVIEISAHGAPVLLQALLQRALDLGAHLAEPGEFTRRAFLHGRIDLTQAEAVRDLIESHTLYQARTAARQLRGAVAQGLRPAHQQCVELIARLEAGIDFAEDDVSVPAAEVLGAAMDQLTDEIAGLEAGFTRGRWVREGISVALVGRPNVGKSSLFNRLLNRDRAIVTAQPGTTRDVITEPLDWDGVAVHLLDTAGLRPSESEAEQLGMERSRQAMADADLVLAIFDRSQPLTSEDQELVAQLAGSPGVLLVANKADLAPAEAGGGEVGAAIAVSARTGEGIGELRAAVRQRVLGDAGTQPEFITNARHAQHLRAAREAVAQAREGLFAGVPHEVLLVDLYEALRQLDAITGQTTVEDILGIIFATFCIGK